MLAIFVVEEKKRETHLAVRTERSGEGVAERLVADEEVMQLVIREHAFREVSDVENGGTSRADCRALKNRDTHENGIYLKKLDKLTVCIWDTRGTSAWFAKGRISWVCVWTTERTVGNFLYI